MANTIKLGNGNWATKEGSLLAYNDENNNFKPLPFTTTRASSASVVNKQGLIETVGSGIPRIDFSDDANGALLLEPTATNLIAYSEDFSDSSWSQAGDTVVLGGFLSPDGTNNAYKVSGTISALTSNYNTLDSLTHSRTIYAKTVSGSGLLHLCSHNSNADSLFTITEEWQRFEVNGYNATGSNNFYGVDFRGSSTLTEVLIWGASAEENSYATSYIKNAGTALGVTRVADTASGSGNSTVINSSEGVLYGEFSNTENDINYNRINLSDGTVTNWVFIGKEGANVRAYLRANNLTVLSNQTTPLASINRVALSYKSGNIKVYINGVQIISLTDAFSFTAPLNQMNFGYYNGGATTTKASWKSVQVYTTALSDAELTSLTTI